MTQFRAKRKGDDHFKISAPLNFNTLHQQNRNSRFRRFHVPRWEFWLPRFSYEPIIQTFWIFFAQVKPFLLTCHSLFFILADLQDREIPGERICFDDVIHQMDIEMMLITICLPKHSQSIDIALMTRHPLFKVLAATDVILFASRKPYPVDAGDGHVFNRHSGNDFVEGWPLYFFIFWHNEIRKGRTGA